MLTVAILSLCLGADPVQATAWHGPNCPRCDEFAPAVATLQAEGWELGWCDTARAPDSARAWNVRTIPVVIVHSGGQEIVRLEGTGPVDWVRAVLRVCGVGRRRGQ